MKKVSIFYVGENKFIYICSTSSKTCKDAKQSFLKRYNDSEHYRQTINAEIKNLIDKHKVKNPIFNEFTIKVLFS